MKKSVIGIAGLAVCFTAQAALVDLSGKGYVTYGDFNSYSLPVAGLEVDSTPGKIKDFIVVATGASGVPVNTNTAGMDDAYSTPNGEGDPNYFQTGETSDPGGAGEFAGDAEDTWDTTLTALQDYLAGEEMVFFFNNNNLNAQNEQSLAAWGQAVIYDASDTIIGVFDFTNNGGAYDLVSEGGGGTFFGDPSAYTAPLMRSDPFVGDNSSTDYVLSGGAVCVDTDTTPPTPVSCTNAAADDGPINHNLGADEAAYAIVAPELNALLQGLFDGGTDLTGYRMSLDIRMGCDPLFGAQSDEICTGELSGWGKNMNNGYEQIFIATATFEPQDISEPGMLFLLATGLIMIGLRKSRIS